MRSEPYHDELHTFRGDTKQRRHRRNGGSSCAMDERRCRHDMIGATRHTTSRSVVRLLAIGRTNLRLVVRPIIGLRSVAGATSGRAIDRRTRRLIVRSVTGRDD